MIAYCYFCETQKCATIAAIIERAFDIRCISPQIIQRKWIKGIASEEIHHLLPGYIFVYADKPLDKLIRIPGIIRRLGDEKGVLRDDDLAFARMIYDHDGVIGIISLVEVSNYCTIDDPLWKNVKGKVIKVDRSRKRCCVEFSFDNNRRTVWLGYELVHAVKEEPPGE